MRIGGFQKVSFIDFPETIASVIFSQGCNWRCPWCHNPALVYPERFEKPIPDTTIYHYLSSRIGSIEGVVVSGGEPTLQHDLGQFLGKIRSMGFKTKLDTNGSRPDHLRQLLEAKLLDFVAMDIKSAPESYNRLCGVEVHLTNIRESIALIQQSGVSHEFRMTHVPHLHQKGDVERAGELVGSKESLKIQHYRPLKPVTINTSHDPAGLLSRSGNCRQNQGKGVRILYAHRYQISSSRGLILSRSNKVASVACSS